MQVSNKATLAAVLILFCLVQPALSMERDEWLANLQSGSEQELIEARQMLPHEGVDVLAAVLDATASPSNQHARTAELVARDIAEGSTAPGRDEERAHATAIISDYLADAETLNENTIGLRLFARTAPEDYPVDAIMAFLDDNDPVIRGKARQALEELGTEPAREALRNLLENGKDDETRAAAARALGNLLDSSAERLLIETIEESTGLLQAHAARALADIAGGDSASASRSVLVEAWSIAEGPARDIAASAVLRLAQRSRGTEPAFARAVYSQLIRDGRGAARVAGAAGLGVVGDAGSAALLAEGATLDSADLRLASLAALGRLPDLAGTDILLSLYDRVSEPERPYALRAIGMRSDASSASLLAREANSSVPAIQLEAIRALGHSSSPAVVEPLAAKTTSDDLSIAAAARESLLRVAESLSDSGESDAASSAYLALATAPAASVTEKRAALAGMANSPSLDALDAVLVLSEDEAVQDAASRLLIDLAVLARVSGDEERAQVAFYRVYSNDDSMEPRMRAIRRLSNASLDPNADALLGPVRNWMAVGPFLVDSVVEEWDAQFLDPKAVDPGQPVLHEGTEMPWKPLTGNGEQAIVDLWGGLGGVSNAFGYAWAEVISPERLIAQLRIGSDDGVTVWLNGAKIHDNKIDRGTVADSDIVRVRLEEGRNTILLRVSQGGGGWACQLRITDLQGNGLNLEETTPR